MHIPPTEDPPAAKNADPTALAQEVRALRHEVQRMNAHRFILLHDSLWKLGLFQLYRGLAFGLGSVLGATILVAIVVRMLSSIDFIPVIGDWAGQVIDHLNTAAGSSGGQ